MKKLILFAAFLMVFLGAKTQVTNKGKLFWVTYPECATFSGSTVDSFVLYMSSDVPTIATVELYGLIGSKRTIKVNPGVLTSFNLSSWNSKLFLDNENTGTKEIKRALRIEADNPITLYAMAIEDAKSDGTFVMPYEAIPNNPTFIVGTYFPNVGGSSNYSPSEFSIVAMDRLTLRIKPAADTRDGKLRGVPFTVSLGKGQVYQLQSKKDQGHNSSNLPSGKVSGDLTGTIISVTGRNCGKFNVFSGNLEARVPYNRCGRGITSSDYLLSQNFPTSVLGKEYVMTPFSTHSQGYVVRVIATQKNTKVWFNGTLATTLNDTGDVYSRNIGSAVATHITSDKPIYALEFMKTDACAGSRVKGDPAILATPTVKQMITRATIGAPKTGRINQFFLNIIIRASAKNAVLLDGVSIPASNFVNIGTSGFAYTTQSIQSRSYNIRCDSGMIAITYGIGDFESYAYCAGATFENLNFDIKVSKSGRCPNSNITFDAILENAYESIEWDFDDGSSDTGRSVLHAFKEAGVYTVKMKVKQKLGCGKLDSNIRSTTIVVDGAKIGFPDTTIVCGPSLNLDLEAPISNDYRYLWQDKSTVQKYNVTAPGKYILSVYDTFSKCTVVDSTTVVQYDTLIGRIGFDTLEPCVNKNRFVLNDFSIFSNDVYGAATWRVLNEDGQTLIFTAKKVTLSFKDTGAYPVYYEITSGKGCFARDTAILNVYNLPKASFNVDDTIKCAGTDFDFTDASTDDGGIFTSYWDFGDGLLDTGLNVQHKYAMHDTFKVSMQAISIYGCRDTADTMLVVKALPQAIIDHTSDNYCLNSHNLTFSDSSKDISGGWSTEWYKNGTFVKNGTNSGNITFSDTGTQEVSIIVTNNYNCIDSADFNVKIYNEPKAIIAVVDSNNCISSNFFDVESNSTASPGENFNYNWSLSDGSSFIVSKFSKSFSTVGSKTIKLVIKTNNGCMDSTERVVQVDSMPMVKINATDTLQCFPGNSFTFETVQNRSGAVKFNWDAGDGTTYTVAKPQHSYAAPGDYTVRLLLTDGPGCEGTQDLNVRVVDKPQSIFTTNIDSFCIGSNTFDFTHSFLVIDYATNWSFGDGTNSTTTNPKGVSFANPGTYNIRLVTEAETVCFDTFERTVKVFGVPQALFSIDDSTQCEDVNSFVITNSTAANGANGLQYSWTLTPGASYSTKDIGPLILPSMGKCDLRLEVESDRGCKTSTNQSIELLANPVVSISAGNQCIGDPVNFIENVTLSKGTIASYAWDYGDGRTGNVVPAVHIYAAEGVYDAELRVLSDQGCLGVSNTQRVTINPRAKASFTGTYLSSRGNESDYEFTSTSTGANQYRWTYNKLPDVDLLPTVNKTFFDTGNLSVQLWVSNIQGCSDSINRNYLLKPQLLYHIPNAFSPNDKTVNDLFRGSSDYGMEDYIMTIYDRWGSVVFRTVNPSEYWDGKDYKGEAMPDGAYAYLITFMYFDGTFYQYKGTVQIIR